MLLQILTAIDTEKRSPGGSSTLFHPFVGFPKKDCRDCNYSGSTYNKRLAKEWSNLALHHSFALRSRRAFAMTDTELKLMAAPAMIGLSSQPKNG
jgi:hypothetical protein